MEWTAIPGDAALGNAEVNPTVVALTATTNLSEVLDVWDQAAFYGERTAPIQTVMCAVTLNAAMIAQGALDVRLPFTAVGAIITNLMRPQVEATTVGSNVVITLAGGGAPNNTVADVIHIVAYA
jgi:hypothetical protein